MKVVLNKEQRTALSQYFSPDNRGEEHPLPEPFLIECKRGQLVLNGLYLHPDGSWATYSVYDQRGRRG
jgi:hypothetical protein